MTKKFYITTAIDYANSSPHIGHAYEKVGADVIARFMRLDGYDVHFQMGNDEHSTNVCEAAKSKGIDPKEYCDQMRKKFEAAWTVLEISNDDFIQTTEARHKEAVAKLFKKLYEAGDIYKGKYQGWYCESCEAFFTEKDLENGLCPSHKKKPKWIDEENYFFKLSKYQEPLLKHFEKHPEFVLPENRKNEIINVIKGGLKDISVSRSSVEWGIPLPIDKTHVVYVWFDALINYISAVDYAKEGKMFKKWWPADVHVIGKDITRFHCVIWPAMLMSAGLPLPKTILTHGFIHLKGEKLSKSRGIVIDPLETAKKYGADALRYYLMRGSSFGNDGDFTWEGFIHRYNSDLANDIGNLLNRTLGMTHKYLSGVIEKPKGENPENENLKKLALATMEKVREHLTPYKNDVNFHSALAAIWELISASDKYIDSSAPWKAVKENPGKVSEILFNVTESLAHIAQLVYPFIPSSAKKIWNQLGLDKKVKLEDIKFKDLKWGKLPTPLKVEQGTPIFPRIETEKKTEETPKGVIMADKISIEEFAKVDLRVANIKEASRVEGADKLLKLQIEIGGEARQIVAGIAKSYDPETLIGKQIAVVTNLKPATIRGIESNGMLLAASDKDGRIVLLTPDKEIPSGSKIK